MDVRVPDVELSLRAEGRKQAGGFRQGYFGPQYELARFSGIGLGFPALADEQLPDAFSVFGELRFRLAQATQVDVEERIRAVRGIGLGIASQRQHARIGRHCRAEDLGTRRGALDGGGHDGLDQRAPRGGADGREHVALAVFGDANVAGEDRKSVV
mgnify:CR=1 FL=1